MDNPQYCTSIPGERPFEPYDPGTVCWLTHSDPDATSFHWSGYWRVSPAEMAPGTPHVSEHRESFVILEGTVELQTADEPPRRLGPGDAVSLPPGTEARWTVLEPMLEFFVYT